MLGDPLIDWLQLYGKNRDYIPKQELAGYDKDLDFLEFIFEQGREFEAGILRLFSEQYEVTTIAQDYRQISRLDKAEETFETMKRGVPIIYQAVLWDAHNMNYGLTRFPSAKRCSASSVPEVHFRTRFGSIRVRPGSQWLALPCSGH